MNKEYIDYINENNLTMLFAEKVFNDQSISYKKAYGDLATEKVINTGSIFHIAGLIKNRSLPATATNDYLEFVTTHIIDLTAEGVITRVTVELFDNGLLDANFSGFEHLNNYDHYQDVLLQSLGQGELFEKFDNWQFRVIRTMATIAEHFEYQLELNNSKALIDLITSTSINSDYKDNDIVTYFFNDDSDLDLITEGEH